jgi:hypothetical protein
VSPVFLQSVERWRGHVPEAFGQLAVRSAGVDSLVLDEVPSVSADDVA